MLNARALTELLTENRDGRLIRSWYLMTTNGTLLAYSQTSSISSLRRQAAIAAVTWDQEATEAPDNSNTNTFRCLTIETVSGNTLIRPLFQNLLLVLEGGAAPRRAGFERRIVVDNGRDLMQVNYADTTGTSPSSTTSSSTTNNVLRMQRVKLEKLAEEVLKEMQGQQFVMPSGLDGAF